MAGYDSEADTREHILQVRKRLARFAGRLDARGEAHDNSKLVWPEKPAYDAMTPKLAGLTYGSDEYRAALQELQPTLQHHYACNSHHPEHEQAANEEWRAVAGYEGRYEVSNFGAVRSCDRTVAREKQGDFPKKGKPLSLQPTPKGYLRVQLSRQGAQKNHMVHQLVAVTFLPNPENKPEVNHKNGRKDDNRWHNLEWSTPTENQEHAYATGLREPAWKYVVTCVELEITTFGCEKMATLLQERGYRAYSSGIWNCVAGQSSTHAGLTFTSQNIAEYRTNQLAGMNLLDLVEMFCDWKAASLRHKDGDFRKSLAINKERFGISDQLAAILENSIGLVE